MLALVRASLTAALLIVSTIAASSADKPYHRDDLAEAAVRLLDGVEPRDGAAHLFRTAQE